VPTYEYQCNECSHRFDIWQSVGEAPPPCPECGATVKKIFHPARVIFKGSGFYVTDTRAEKEAKSGSKPSSASTGSTSSGESKSTGSESGGDTKTESKPEAKTDAAPASPSPSDKK